MATISVFIEGDLRVSASPSASPLFIRERLSLKQKKSRAKQLPVIPQMTGIPPPSALYTLERYRSATSPTPWSLLSAWGTVHDFINDLAWAYQGHDNTKQLKGKINTKYYTVNHKTRLYDTCIRLSNCR